MFSESDNLFMAFLATRKHGSEVDFLIMARVNILCWNSAGSYAWGKIWLLCYFLREQMLIS